MVVNKEAQQECLSIWGKAVYQDKKEKPKIKVIDVNELFKAKVRG